MKGDTPLNDGLLLNGFIPVLDAPEHTETFFQPNLQGPQFQHGKTRVGRRFHTGFQNACP